jgi:PIN domain nuclease of toxin-antitoxin system
VAGFLLDTHAFLWMASGDPRLGESAAETILRNDTDLYLSVASVWELAIKSSLARLKLHLPLAMLVRQQLERNAIRLLEVGFEHALRVETLPFIHRDPFDRLLIAQALEEDLTLLSRDDVLDDYAVRRVWM